VRRAERRSRKNGTRPAVRPLSRTVKENQLAAVVCEADVDPSEEVEQGRLRT